LRSNGNDNIHENVSDERIDELLRDTGFAARYFFIFFQPAIRIEYNINRFFVMNTKNIALAGIIVGVILLVLMVTINMMMNLIIPVDLSSYGGMRAMDDPIMLLFFFYPFIVAFAAAIVFDTVEPLKGMQMQKGLMFGVLLLIIMTIPSLYVMYTSMTWPVAFYISTGFWEAVSFPIAGIIFARIGKL
jgi:hypothetical protein